MNPDIERAAIALYDRFTHEGMDRRVFMAELSRIAGSAAAASLLLTSVACRASEPEVESGDPRIAAGETRWEVAPGRLYRGYEARPAGAAADVPAVVVIHENRGLNDHIRDVARRLAVAGFGALAPDFLSGAGGTPAEEDRARAMIGELNMMQTVADGAATIAHLKASGRRVGVVGFCWGGGMVHRLAIAAGPQLDAAASFYGPAPEPAEAPRVQAPLLVILAGRDDRVNRTAGPWVDALQQAGKDVSRIVYQNADHAFHNDTSALRYDPEAARQAWTATLQFFEQHLRRRG